MKKSTPFRWHPDQPPPLIEAHSEAKLAVLRSYLCAYFDRLNVSPHRENFKLDLVDGFAGGGTFLDASGNTIVGTPLIMLEELKAANDRLNRKRVKRLNFDCKCYFVDIEKAHTDHLQKVLDERGYSVDGDKIVVRNGRFEEEIDSILKEIQRRQPRVGRAIFLLDQTGFSQVELNLVARIFGELPAAEVILTFAADALINHLAETPAMIKMTAPTGLEARIHDLIQQRDSKGGRALVQRTLRDHIRTMTGATYDTPFFIRPQQSRRALWFLHLSRHPTARDVMMQVHWNVQNTFEHYGPGDFGMLGWDTFNSGTLPVLNFKELEITQMRQSLLDSMPAELFSLVSEKPVTVCTMRHLFANRTAARFLDLDEVVLDLFQEKEFDIMTPDGKVRSRKLRRLRPTDLIALPSIPLLPGISRRR